MHKRTLSDRRVALLSDCVSLLGFGRRAGEIEFSVSTEGSRARERFSFRNIQNCVLLLHDAKRMPTCCHHKDIIISGPYRGDRGFVNGRATEFAPSNEPELCGYV